MKILFLLLLLLFCFFSKTTVADPATGDDKVRNVLGAQVGILFGPYLPLQPQSTREHVFPSGSFSKIPLETIEQFPVVDIAVRKKDKNPNYFVVLGISDVTHNSTLMVAHATFPVLQAGDYATVLRQTNYTSTQPCTEDVCFVCDGDGSSCLDCRSIPFGKWKYDACGVCGGDGSMCEATR